MKLRLDHPFWRRRVPRLAATLMRGYLRTCRVRVVADPETEKLMCSGAPVLYTMWHGHLLYPLYYFSIFCPRLVILASPSRDGEFTAEFARAWGYAVCRGSQHKGGIQGLKDMASYLRRGYTGGIMADGSRGPARVAQKGVLFLAREAQAPLIPLAMASSRKKTFNSWDRFELPLPYSNLMMLVGEPLWVRAQDKGPALDPLRRELENRLQELFARSQAYFAAGENFR
jgi:lysophospholipid acyltransferase (LPLAT)-like uncharacterized protein